MLPADSVVSNYTLSDYALTRQSPGGRSPFIQRSLHPQGLSLVYL